MQAQKIFSLVLPLLTVITYAQDSLQGSTVALDEVILEANVIFGSKFQAKNRTGSAYYISPQEMAKFQYTDVTRLLRSVPGVNVYEEDGFGLRPNISLRGTSAERSAKITLMEDGILIAPAPYSAPAAYYFPSVGRMAGIEVLKGSSQVQFGPFTTGGAINMISAGIPEDLSASLRTQYGSFNSGQFHAKLGDHTGKSGYLIEYLNYQSDGFKNLNSGANTGFDKNDLLAKFRIELNSNGGKQHELELKLQYSDEDSRETYLGLTKQDFKNNPYFRYAASEKDRMVADHNQIALTHTVNFGSNLRLTSTGYRNHFSRNWYKLNDVTLDNQKIGLSDIVANPEGYPAYYEVITGNNTANYNHSLSVKANNRKYYSEGVQSKLDWHWYGSETFHDLEIGMRYHRDSEDRFQWVDLFTLTDGNLILNEAGIPGSDANRISMAAAWAGFGIYRFKYGNLTLTPGIRHEIISLSRLDYGKNDPSRTGLLLNTRENALTVWIPGVGFSYNLNTLTLFGGVHRGFSPPGNAPGQLPEKSVNYELGTRFGIAGINGELTGFYNDYSNLLGSDLAASGGTGNLDQFNAGSVSVKGMEVLLNYEFLPKNKSISIPITFNYTLTDSKFRSSFGSEDALWGTVTSGDELPYLARNQWNVTIGLEHEKIEVNLNSRYTGAFRTRSGSGPIPENERINSNFVLDLGSKYSVSEHVVLTANILNLLNARYAVSSVPAGLRPGHPFGIYTGINLNF